MHISDMTDVAPPGVASKTITSHCHVSNQHIAHDSVTPAYCTVSHPYFAPDLVTAAHCTVSYQHIAPDRTTHIVEPMDISPLALNTVNSPVHATTSSVEPTDISPIAYDTVSSPASATLKSLTPPDVRSPTISNVPSDAFTSAAASGNEQVAMDMLLSDERANINTHDNKGRRYLHWTGNYGMTRLAELLLCRADIYIDVFDDNGDTATILAAKMNDASVAWSWT